MAKFVYGVMTPAAGEASSRGFHIASAFLRTSLGVGLLSAVADRLGLWGPPGTAMVSWGDFHNFLFYTAKLNPWCPGKYLPLLGVGTTIAEAGLGILLIVGLWTPIVSFLTGILTLTFAGAMTAVLGVHAPLNYEVFVFSAASFVLSSFRPDKLSLDMLLGLTASRTAPKAESIAQ